MAIIKFKNTDGTWETVETPGAVKYTEAQNLSDAEKAIAKANLGITDGSSDNNTIIYYMGTWDTFETTITGDMDALPFEYNDFIAQLDDPSKRVCLYYSRIAYQAAYYQLPCLLECTSYLNSSTHGTTVTVTFSGNQGKTNYTLTITFNKDSWEYSITLEAASLATEAQVEESGDLIITFPVSAIGGIQYIAAYDQYNGMINFSSNNTLDSITVAIEEGREAIIRMEENQSANTPVIDGHYIRFMEIRMTKCDIITTGYYDYRGIGEIHYLDVSTNSMPTSMVPVTKSTVYAYGSLTNGPGLRFYVKKLPEEIVINTIPTSTVDALFT